MKAAAQGFRPNPAFKSEDAILDLGTGEALVSFLDEDGRPCVVERAKILPPQCLMAAANEETMQFALFKQQDLQAKYGTAIDRESAFEVIAAAKEEQAKADALAAEQAALEKEKAAWEAKKAK